MDNIKRKSNKNSLKKILSLGLIVLGIGFVSWAAFHVFSQPNYYFKSSEIRLSPTPAAPTPATNNTSEHNSKPAKKDISKTVNKDSSKKPNVYSKSLSVGENIGSLIIPKLSLKFPIIQGTGEPELALGVGHFIKSALPGENDNCVLSGHRNTVFARLGEIKKGSQLIIQTSSGIFIYKVTGTKIVHANDRTVIVHTGHTVLTLTTCYPFIYNGHAPDRFIVSADLVTDR
ncbi:MAG: class D sortase [Clostridia bacterium]|jgi:sortase A